MRSISGINRWIVDLNLSSADAGVGVDPDPNVSNTNIYFTNDYSLTISSDEEQTVTPFAPFILTFAGHATSSLSPAATQAQVQDALNALPSIGGVGGSVIVRKTGTTFTVIFGGALAGENQPALQSATAIVTTINEGGVTGDVQLVTVAGTNGTFTLEFGGRVTAPLPFDATAAQVQEALELPQPSATSMAPLS